MKLVIAETGIPPQGLDDIYGSYPDMMRQMLKDAGLSVETQDVLVCDGEKMPGPEDDSALLITGSPVGAYEGHDWFSSLEEGIRDWASAARPMVGICFGHQIMAQALGGKVEKSEKGWGVGVHTYELTREIGFEHRPNRVACVVSHQDQVVRLPDGAERVGGSPFCPNGIIRYGASRALSFQLHPEFSHEFAAALLDARAESIPQDRAVVARETFPNETDRPFLGRWIAEFLKGEIA